MSYSTAKRVFDVLAATLLVVITAPLWLLSISLLLLLQGRPLFYRQQRVGLFDRPFVLLKFRTMIAAPPRRFADRPVAKFPNDPRITPFGRFLRRFAIDELPQLLHVLQGEMSMVGPRPLPLDDLQQPGWLRGLDEAERLRRLEWARRRHQVLPGLTGRWQISRAPAEDFANWLACDLDYVAHHSLPGDLAIALRTPVAILRGRLSPTRQDSRDTV